MEMYNLFENYDCDCWIRKENILRIVKNDVRFPDVVVWYSDLVGMIVQFRIPLQERIVPPDDDLGVCCHQTSLGILEK